MQFKLMRKKKIAVVPTQIN